MQGRPPPSSSSYYFLVNCCPEFITQFIFVCLHRPKSTFAYTNSGIHSLSILATYIHITSKLKTLAKTLLGPVLPNLFSVQFSSVQFNSVQFSSVQFNSVQFSSVQFSSDQFSSVQLLTILLLSHITIHFSSVQFSSVQFNCFMPKRTGP